MIRLDAEGGPWRVVLTCESEDWEVLAALLLRRGVSIQSLRTELVDFPTKDQLKPVWEAFPNLRPLSLHRELASVLRNLHILNVVASHATQTVGIVSDRWVGLSDVIRWFWRDVVLGEEKAYARSRLLQKLARNEAEGTTPRLAVSELTDADVSVFGELVKKRICRERDGRVSFTHDLYGDWARLQALIPETGNLAEFLTDRITIPRWLKAVRLLGIDLLEKRPGDTTVWSDAVARLRIAVGKYDLRADLLLESLVFAANPTPLLEAVYPTLVADGGVLLRRLLNRFLYAATLPNPAALLLIREGGEEMSSIAATTDRDPNWPYWPAMLSFLASHSAEVATLAPTEAARVASTWLRKAPRTWRWRAEAAKLAVVVAMSFFARENRRYDPENKECEAVLVALVAACIERPDEVESVLLSICKRIRMPANALTVVSSEISRRSFTVVPSLHSRTVPLSPPWPDGPNERVDETVGTVLLGSGTLNPMFPTRPSLAREVILALTIMHPVRAIAHEHYSPHQRDHGTKSPRDWHARMWHRGPFLAFLMQAPEEGLDTIIRLVNHATERWAESVVRRWPKRVSFTFTVESESQSCLGTRMSISGTTTVRTVRTPSSAP